jgi:hypothetical protein
MTNLTDKPLASHGFESYRYRSKYGWIMIGAKDHADALNEANRSLTGEKAELSLLEIWTGKQYEPVEPGGNHE